MTHATNLPSNFQLQVRMAAAAASAAIDRQSGTSVSKHLKWVALGALVIQNSALVLTMRYSRTIVPKDELYISSTVVIVGEVVKLMLATVFLFQVSMCVPRM